MPTSRAEPSVSKEYQLKAAFLYNFAKFVQWPAKSFANADSPIVIGVYHQNPFGNELVNVVSGRSINGRRVIVTAVPTAAAARQTHLLFVGAAVAGKFEELKEALRDTSVLTVGESELFARQGGMITFALQSDTLRFAINKNAAQQAGVKISAQLQKLASETPK